MNAIKTLALVSALFAAQSALAATYDLGTMGPPGTATETVSTGAGFILDTFTFSINAPATASGTTTENGQWGGFLGLVLTGADVTSITLYNNASNIASQIIQAGLNLDSTPSSFSFSNLAAGSYSLLVNAVTGKSGGGSYTVNLTTTAVATAVPEPEAYAMMLAGLGLVGFAARRKFSA